MSQKKIETVIDNCAMCKYSKEFQEKSGNSSFLLMCNHAYLTAGTEEEGEKIKNDTKNGLIFITENSKPIKGNLDVPIIYSCPLENYNSKKEIIV